MHGGSSPSTPSACRQKSPSPLARRPSPLAPRPSLLFSCLLQRTFSRLPLSLPLPAVAFMKVPELWIKRTRGGFYAVTGFATGSYAVALGAPRVGNSRSK